MVKNSWKQRDFNKKIFSCFKIEMTFNIKNHAFIEQNEAKIIGIYGSKMCNNSSESLSSLWGKNFIMGLFFVKLDNQIKYCKLPCISKYHILIPAPLFFNEKVLLCGNVKKCWIAKRVKVDMVAEPCFFPEKSETSFA